MQPAFHANQADAFDHLEALKQLTLSRYWPNFLGQDVVSRKDVGWTYITPSVGISLRKLLQHSGPLSESDVLFRYYSREILCALVDYFEQCSFALGDPITLDNVFICDNGLRVQLRNVRFSGVRADDHSDAPPSHQSSLFRDTSHCLEQRLLEMYGEMLLEMLYGEDKENSPIQTLSEISAAVRSVIILCVHARQTHDAVVDQSAKLG